MIAVAAVAFAAAAQTLAVPYLPQTEDLCGGAAAAMVMRYWGASEIYPDAFEPLVDHSAGGIRTGALTADLQRRGWTAIAGPGDRAEIAKELGRGRPVITLIQDSPRRYHYVVVVGWDGRTVTLHDPARAPSRVLDVRAFDREWGKSGRWMLILLPPEHAAAETPAPPDEHTASSSTESACDRIVAGAVAAAPTDPAAARTILTRATGICAADGAAWRELAGLDALESNWTAAAAHAREAVARDPGDSYAWRILATADYVGHDDLGALTAWNRIGEPQVSLIDIQGLERTRYGVIADAIGVPLKSTLTPAAMRRAERRVRDVPAIAAARVAYHPLENGRVRIDASVVERAHAPTSYLSWAGIGFDALTNRQLSLSSNSLTGGGEAVGVTWRWWEHRPMIAGFVAAPAPRVLGGGTWRLEASRASETFGPARTVETRARVGVNVGHWLTDRTRVSGGAALERWNDRGDDVALAVGVEHWRLRDRLRIAANLTQAVGDPYAIADVTAAARTTTSLSGPLLTGIAGYAAANRRAPFTVWPGADTGHARDVLLRAHPLLEDGVIAGGAFGRQLVFGTLEGQWWRLLRRAPVRVAPAVFVDVARASRVQQDRAYIDAGGGIRIALPGFGVMRVDLAHGLRGGGTVLSAGWDVRWR